jgi:hypothetical protein
MRSCRRFLAGIPHREVGTHVLLTRPPLPYLRKGVRLACVRHAASVYPEPGSNSPFSCVSHRSLCKERERAEVKRSKRSIVAMLVLADSCVTHELTGTLAFQFCFPHFNCSRCAHDMAEIFALPVLHQNEQFRYTYRFRSHPLTAVVSHISRKLSRGFSWEFFAPIGLSSHSLTHAILPRYRQNTYIV